LPIADFRLVLAQHALFALTGKTMNADELKERTKQFALRILKTCCCNAEQHSGKNDRRPTRTSGNIVGANYRAACRGRSREEFVAKLGVGEEEADESAFWLELIIESALLRRKQVEPLLNKANELAKIMARSRISASGATHNKSAIGNRNSKLKLNRQSAIGNRQ
jgi:four helix bundle protein